MEQKEILNTTNANGKKLTIKSDIASDDLYWIDIQDINGKLIDSFPITDKQIMNIYWNR